MEIMKQRDFKELMLKYEFAQKRLITELDILLEEFEFNNGYNPVEHTKSRIKKMDSIVKKLDRKGYEVTTDSIQRHVHDVVGLRIVCSFLSDVYDIINIIKSSKQFIIIALLQISYSFISIRLTFKLIINLSFIKLLL